jgi:uncharacterized paraquat-inducible protein A
MRINGSGWAAKIALAALGAALAIVAVVATLLVLLVVLALLPIFAVASFFRRTPGRPEDREISDREKTCPSCGFVLHANSPQVVCTRCNTVFGFDTNISHGNVEVVQLLDAKTQPRADDRR